jgi:pimeloyl-ACP methyl ester carboxylesterase
MNRVRARSIYPAVAVLVALTTAVACSGDDDTEETVVATASSSTSSTSTSGSHTTDGTAPDDAVVAAAGTTFLVERRGAGEPLLLVHGAGEDGATLAPQADSLAAAGYEVVTYDRRGTGRSGRDDWPGTGAPQHADDAAALLAALDLGPATVVGVSSGAVIALELAARHPDAVQRVVAWEPPAAGVVPGGAEITAGIMAPVEQHLAEHPGDFVGAQAILLSALVGFPVAVDDPAFAAARAHAEPMVRDDPAITLATFTSADLAGRDVTLAIGSEPNEVVAAGVAALATLAGIEPVTVTGPHEVYLADPAVLTGVVTATR